MDINALEVKKQKSIEVFCCYAHKDESLLVKLKNHLMPLQHERLITVWTDMDISAGAVRKEEIHRHLNTARVILLLVSPDFVADEDCCAVEVSQAMQRHEHGEEVRVIPIILRHVAWDGMPFAKLQALPKDGVPVTDKRWGSQDEAFRSISEEIRDVVKSLHIGSGQQGNETNTSLFDACLSSLIKSAPNWLGPFREQVSLTEPAQRMGSRSKGDDIASEGTTPGQGSDGSYPSQVSHYYIALDKDKKTVTVRLDN